MSQPSEKIRDELASPRPARRQAEAAKQLAQNIAAPGIVEAELRLRRDVTDLVTCARGIGS